MKKSKWMIGIFALLLVAMSGIQAFPFRQAEPTKQIEELKKQMTALEQKVATLESRLEKLRLAIPQTFPDLKQLPKGWEKREFNGMKYYIVPIEQEPIKAKPVIR
jgi:septal ring factor EnvC (AmiA/AmiB activator)